LKWSDYSGIRKLTSITFYKYMAKKKKQKVWKSQPSKTRAYMREIWFL
jgi:hypothetical protein